MVQVPEPIAVQARTTIPTSVRAACILWIIYGGLGIAGGAIAMMGSRWGASSGGNLLFGAAFLVTGIQALRGQPSNVRGAGIACIGLGVVVLAMFAWIGNAGQGHLAVDVSMVLMIVNAALLVAAGIFAIVGNAQYVRWRETLQRR